MNTRNLFSYSYAAHNWPRSRAGVHTHHSFIPSYIVTKESGDLQTPDLLQHIAPWTTSTHLVVWRLHLGLPKGTDTNCLDGAAGLLQAARIYMPQQLRLRTTLGQDCHAALTTANWPVVTFMIALLKNKIMLSHFTPLPKVNLSWKHGRPLAPEVEVWGEGNATSHVTWALVTTPGLQRSSFQPLVYPLSPLSVTSLEVTSKRQWGQNHLDGSILSSLLYIWRQPIIPVNVKVFTQDITTICSGSEKHFTLCNYFSHLPVWSSPSQTNNSLNYYTISHLIKAHNYLRLPLFDGGSIWTGVTQEKKRYCKLIKYNKVILLVKKLENFSF